MGYLDDFVVGGGVDLLIDQVGVIEARAASLGLFLNHVKCEVVGLSVSQRLRWSSSSLGIPEVPINEASLLGSPLGEGGVEQVLE